MGKLIDLTGRTFGKLHVIKRVEDKKKGRHMWLCECECGNTTTVSSTALTSPNGTRSCGCLRHRQSPTIIDLTDQIFGDLLVLYRDKSSKYGTARWVCKCMCGNIVTVSSDCLRNGHTRSCGCKRKRLTHNLVGQKFGHLRVLEPTTNNYIKGNEIRWKCICENCGNIVEVGSYWLRHGNPYGHCRCTRFKKS